MKPNWGPFGFLDSANEKAAFGKPPNWFAKHGKDNDWNTAFKRNADEIASAIWPQWDQQNSCWSHSGISMKLASRLARVDVLSCVALAPHLRETLFHGGKATHRTMFESEDTVHFQDCIPAYLATTHISGNFSARAQAAASNFGILIFAYKQHFRRPRPYTAALVLGLKRFPWLYAYSSLHPSLISGHAAQGLLGITSAWAQESVEVRNESSARAMQLAVDFGDRRVMAGVHYPSDNFASWVTVVRYIKHFKSWDEGKKIAALDFMRNAIFLHSSVYKHCRASEQRAAYDALAGWLERAFVEERLHILDAQ